MQLPVELLKLNELPPLSPIAQRILHAVGREDISLRELSISLEQSPALTARILGLANSAYFGYSGEVVTLTDAIIRVLGLKMVRSVAIAFSLSSSLELGKCPAFRPELYWKSAMLTAFLAQEFIFSVQSALGLTLGHECFTAGLLTNLGVLGLVHLFPRVMNEALLEHRLQSDVPLGTLIFKRCGYDHATVGSWLITRWHLPDLFRATIEHRRNLDYQGEYWPIVLLIGMCAELAQQLFANNAPMVDPRLARLGLSATDQQMIVTSIQSKSSSLDEIARVLAGSTR